MCSGRQKGSSPQICADDRRSRKSCRESTRMNTNQNRLIRARPRKSAVRFCRFPDLAMTLHRSEARRGGPENAELLHRYKRFGFCQLLAVGVGTLAVPDQLRVIAGRFFFLVGHLRCAGRTVKTIEAVGIGLERDLV